jgi:hypothetical protein
MQAAFQRELHLFAGRRPYSWIAQNVDGIDRNLLLTLCEKGALVSIMFQVIKSILRRVAVKRAETPVVP